MSAEKDAMDVIVLDDDGKEEIRFLNYSEHSSK